MADSTAEKQSPLPLEPGTRIETYELVGAASPGAVVIAYPAFDHALGRVVTIEEFAPAGLALRVADGRIAAASTALEQAFEAARDAFVRLSRQFAQISHPAVQAVFRYWTGRGTAYRVLGVPPGPTLQAQGFVAGMAAGSARFPSDELPRLARQLLEALEVLERSGTVHRELSPARIAWSPGRPAMLLAPHGAAPSREPDCLPYIAPELRREAIAPIGPWTDLYALGATLRALNVGWPPVDAFGRLSGIGASPSRGDQLSFGGFIDRLFELRVDDRPQTSAQALAWLDELGASSGSVARLDYQPQASVELEPPIVSAPHPVPPTPREPPVALGTGAPARAPSVLSSALGAALALPVAIADAARRLLKHRLPRSTPPEAQARIDSPSDRGPSTGFGPAAAEPLHFGLSAPDRAAPRSQFSLLVAAYVESQRPALLEHLDALAEPSHRRRLGLPSDHDCAWAIGTPFVVRVAGAHFDTAPAARSFTWNGSRNVVGFTVTVRADAPVTAVLEVVIAAAGVIVSALPLTLTIDQAAPQACALKPSARPFLATSGEAADAPRVEAIAPQSMFASYASKDAVEVSGRLSTLQHFSPGLDIFQDCLDLKASDAWKPQLEAQIRGRDAFALFWSRHAAQSQWVRWELETALASKGAAAILPMPLEDPSLAPPPEALAGVQLRDRFMLAGYGMAKLAELSHGP